MASPSSSKKSVIALLITLLITVALLAAVINYEYWLKQIGYIFSKPTAPTLLVGAPTDSLVEVEPNMLFIDNLNIEAPIVFIDTPNESGFQEKLKGGVVHYPGTAPIGDYGNAYLFGHSSDYIWKGGNYKTIFALLPKIKVGDKIIASDQKGDVFKYTVIKTLVASPRDTNLLSQYNNEKKILTLQTSYPIGTALKRFIVIAETD